MLHPPPNRSSTILWSQTQLEYAQVSPRKRLFLRKNTDLVLQVVM